jgi:hypothetical protein
MKTRREPTAAEYTPTTEEVRARYQTASRNKFGHRDPKRITDTEFDRWLAKVRAEAWDEGYSAAAEYVDGPDWAAPPPNPHRENGGA